MKTIWRGMVILLLLLTIGCEYKDIDRRIFVVAIGIDPGQKEDSYKVSIKIAIPQGDVSKIDEKVQILTQESSSISEAMRRMKSKVDKELDYVHCKSIVLGEGLADQDVGHVLDWAIRRRDIQLILNFAIGRPDALKVLEVRPPTERIPSNSLFMAMSGQGTESPFITSVYAYQLMRSFYERGVDPTLPIIEAMGKDQFLIDKVALLDKQKIRLVLSPDETRLYNLLSRSNLRSNFPASIDGEMYQYYTESSRSSYRISTTAEGETRIRYKIKITGIVEESGTEDLVTHSKLKEISQAAGEDLEKDLIALLMKIRDSGLDPFGWGLHYGARHWNNDTEMKVWAAMFPELQFEVTADVDVKYSGMIR